MKEEIAEETKYRIKGRPADDFYEGYCRYMLLKIKIKYRVYETADDILEETDECLSVLKKLQLRIPGERNNFMVTEIAYILNESMTAINDWVSERELDEKWLTKFISKRETI